MDILDTPNAASKWCSQVRKDGSTLGFVPTMGALHDGHLSLVRRSIRENDRTCVSIFVNPLQFNDREDFNRYPSDSETDWRLLKNNACDMVFSGTSRDVFPEAASTDKVERIDPGPFAKGLEGHFRPGHLEGVCTVVERLFGFVGQCQAYFGEKDYQQLLVIQDLARRLGYPKIVPCPTQRDSDGLALSSRNRLLSRRQRREALLINRALNRAQELWQSGERNFEMLNQAMVGIMESGELEIEYAQVRDPNNWLDESNLSEHAIALIAAKAGSVRLIDNLRLS